MLSPRGSARHVISVANSREQAGILLAFAREIVERSPLLRAQIAFSREDKIVFTGGGCSSRRPVRTG